mmetsp:Transcript_3155/g.4960  ORF Transcript_3155/g.4960 Transcript_3155/m.4960 type:complete len:231 (-) Transcript_3155:406-1098(-)
MLRVVLAGPAGARALLRAGERGAECRGVGRGVGGPPHPLPGGPGLRTVLRPSGRPAADCRQYSLPLALGSVHHWAHGASGQRWSPVLRTAPGGPGPRAPLARAPQPLADTALAREACFPPGIPIARTRRANSPCARAVPRRGCSARALHVRVEGGCRCIGGGPRAGGCGACGGERRGRAGGWDRECPRGEQCTGPGAWGGRAPREAPRCAKHCNRRRSACSLTPRLSICG